MVKQWQLTLDLIASVKTVYSVNKSVHLKLKKTKKQQFYNYSIVSVSQQNLRST